MNSSGERLVRADYTDETITVYQAYSPQIADAAVRAARFVPPFSRERMTWIKPSFGWMMQRCGWAHKSGQERVLAISVHPLSSCLAARICAGPGTEPAAGGGMQERGARP